MAIKHGLTSAGVAAIAAVIATCVVIYGPARHAFRVNESPDRLDAVEPAVFTISNRVEHLEGVVIGISNIVGRLQMLDGRYTDLVVSNQERILAAESAHSNHDRIMMQKLDRLDRLLPKTP